MPKLGLTPTGAQVQDYLDKYLTCTLGGKYCYFKCLRAFYNWLYSPHSGYALYSLDNPILALETPQRPQRILPSLSIGQVKFLIDSTTDLQDKAVMALLTESGLRLAEIANISFTDIDWTQRIIRVVGKGNKEAYAPFGELSERYLQEWLRVRPPQQTIWSLHYWGISTMLKRLANKTGLPCNPHTFRRTFACLLRKAGVDTMIIKELGRWESLEMVQRYTRSITFQDSLKFYRAPLS